MWGSIGALAFLLLVCGGIGGVLWFALAKGKLPASYGVGPPIYRAKSPITFWFGFIVWTLILLPFAAMLVMSVCNVISGGKLYGAG